MCVPVCTMQKQARFSFLHTNIHLDLSSVKKNVECTNIALHPTSYALNRCDRGCAGQPYLVGSCALQNLRTQQCVSNTPSRTRHVLLMGSCCLDGLARL